jgi:dTDP-4-dehydrorhamnose 3,5-epimerase
MAEIKKTSLSGVLEIFPKVFEVERGYFIESFRAYWFEK